MDYLFGDQALNSQDPGFQLALKDAHARSLRPLCCCVSGGLPMYTAHAFGRYLLKRMPGTGDQHSRACGSFETPPDNSGLGELIAGGAITENPDDGTTLLKLDFRLTSRGGTPQKLAKGAEQTSARTDGKKLTLRGLLHVLWLESKISYWAPGFAGKRHRGLIRWLLHTNAEPMMISQGPLLEALYIPPVFSVTEKAAQRTDRIRFFSSTRGDKESPKQLKMLLGEVKSFDQLRNSHVLSILDMPDAPLVLPDDLHRRMLKNFEGVLGLWEANPTGHLIALCTVGLGSSGRYMVDELTLMMVDSHWLPYSTTEEMELLERLISEMRTFSKPLLCNRPKDTPIAGATLHDTGDELRELYLLFPENDITRDVLEKYIVEMGGRSVEDTWIWEVAEGVMPPLPPKRLILPSRTN